MSAAAPGQQRGERDRDQIGTDAGSIAGERYGPELLENAKRDADYKKTIDELKRKMEQGSQQTQGEVVELLINTPLLWHNSFHF